VRPTFLLTFDLELVWGSFDHMSASQFEAVYPDVRGVIRDVLGLLETHGISATWAIVGHLFLSDCERGADGRAHPDLPRPAYSWRDEDWFADDPCTDRHRDPLWYGDDLVELLIGASVPQEIASHSFAHALYETPGCDSSVAAADLDACITLARQRGITLRSFVFPRNREGHHAVIRDHGFVAYRGVDPTWYRRIHGPLRRVAHVADEALGTTPPVTLPAETLPGLWNIPGSMMLYPRKGSRRFIPMATRRRRARSGLQRAVREGKVFHLWCHPFNLVHDRSAMLSLLDRLLAEAARLRTAGALDITTMGALAVSMQAAEESGR